MTHRGPSNPEHSVIASAQLHLKPDSQQNQENLQISAAAVTCANLIQGISGMPANAVTRPPAAVQMCLPVRCEKREISDRKV